MPGSSGDKNAPRRSKNAVGLTCYTHRANGEKRHFWGLESAFTETGLFRKLLTYKKVYHLAAKQVNSSEVKTSGLAGGFDLPLGQVIGMARGSSKAVYRV